MSTVDLLIFTFRDTDNAEEALGLLKKMKKEGVINLVNAAILVRDEQGRVQMSEIADPGRKQGALFGAVL